MQNRKLVMWGATILLVIVAIVIGLFLRNGIDFLTGNSTNDSSVAVSQTATAESADNSNSSTDESESVSSATTTSSASTSVPTQTSSEETTTLIVYDGQEREFHSGSFEELTTDPNMTNVGYVGYESAHIVPEGATADNCNLDEQPKLIDFYKDFTETAGLVPSHDVNGNVQKLYTGHTIYTKANITQGERDTAPATATFRYIINGFDTLELDAYDLIPEDEGYLLREEYSTNRIRLFDTQEELDAANAAWDAGQSILNGDSAEIPGGIILDGCLLDNNITWYIDTDGTLCVPLDEVAEQFSDDAYVTTSGVLHIPLYEGCGNASIEIPSRKSKGFDQEVIAFGIDTENETWHYTGWLDGSLWEADFPLTSNFNFPVEKASQLTGWRFYFDGTMLNIVTEDCNVNNNFILRVNHE